MMDAIGAEELEELRRTEFPVSQRLAYLDHAAVSPLPVRTAQLLDERIAALQDPSLEQGHRERYAAEAQERLGRLLNVPPKQIALLTNLGEAMATVANGLDLRPGDEIVIPEKEFSSLVYPWLLQERRGAKVVWVPKPGASTDLDRIEAALTPRTRVVALSHVEFLNGYRHDMLALGALCRARDVLLAVDVTQSLGVLPVDVAAWGADVAAAHGYKWLMAFHGIAALSVSERAMEQIAPTVPGRSSVTGGFASLEFALDWHPDARRYQSGGPNWTGAAAVARSLSLTEEIGIELAGRQARSVIDRVFDGLAGLPVAITSDPRPEHRSSIMAFTFGSRERDEAFQKQAKKQGVYAGLRNLGVRVAAHYWNSAADADRLLDAVAEAAASK
jgi:cysteine desulfurase / selenocysteine lyase